METRHCWRYQYSVKMCFTLILLMVQIMHASASHGHRANSHSQPHFSSSLEAVTSQRRDIASISVTEVNRSRNLRQTYDDNAYKYTEIHPANNHFQSDIDNSVERNSTDNRKPAFFGCKDYAPKVKEEQQWNTFVIQVKAVDPDEADTITYSFEKSGNERAKFRINDKTGEIVTSYTFDRDEPIREKEVSVRHFLLSPSTLVVFFFYRYSHTFHKTYSSPEIAHFL